MTNTSPIDRRGVSPEVAGLCQLKSVDLYSLYLYGTLILFRGSWTYYEYQTLQNGEVQTGGKASLFLSDLNRIDSAAFASH